MALLSPAAQAFLREKVYAHLATLMKGGAPQVTPVWVDTDGVNVFDNPPFMVSIRASLSRREVSEQ